MGITPHLMVELAYLFSFAAANTILGKTVYLFELVIDIIRSVGHSHCKCPIKTHYLSLPEAYNRTIS